MPDQRAVQRRRHDADEHVIMPTNLGSQIGVLGEDFVCKMSAGNNHVVDVDVVPDRAPVAIYLQPAGNYAETVKPRRS